MRKEDIMADAKEKIVYLSPEGLTPYEYNAREHGSEIEFLKNSIKEFGFRNPILIDKDHVVIAGHGRRMAAMELGLEKVPCIVCSDLTPEQVRALRLADNKVSDMSGWSFEKLDFELGALKDMGWNMQSFGFEDMAQFDIEEPEPMGGGDTDYITEAEPLKAEEFRIMVALSSKKDQDELFERLVRDGYDCQLL